MAWGFEIHTLPPEKNLSLTNNLPTGKKRACFWRPALERIDARSQPTSVFDSCSP